MRWALAVTGVGVAVALVALGFLHQELQPVRAALCGGLGLLATLILRRGTWSELPPFIGVWLDGGAAVVAGLVAAATTAASYGPAYMVLRWQELSLLSATASLLAIALASFAYTHLRLATEVALQAARLAASQQLALESRLATLSAQINPHFLFNTLNTLSELIHQDEDRAEDLVTDLAAMMRYALQSSTGRVLLTEELDVVRTLLRIEQARLGDRLVWTVETRGDLTGVRIPGLLVQPLVENAVQHAVATRASGGRVVVTAVRDGAQVRIGVADDGPGLPDAVRTTLAGETGVGLRNTAERVRLAWPEGAAQLTVEPGPGTRLMLVVPA